MSKERLTLVDQFSHEKVNQLLAKIDGLEQQQNVLVIGTTTLDDLFFLSLFRSVANVSFSLFLVPPSGTTNRKDMMDPAVLRPGRLEVHVMLGLPVSLSFSRSFASVSLLEMCFSPLS